MVPIVLTLVENDSGKFSVIEMKKKSKNNEKRLKNGLNFNIFQQ